MSELNGWAEWSKFVLKELERLNSCYNHLDKKLDDVALEIATLKVKAGVWGLLGGAIPVVVGLALWFLQKGDK